MVVYIDIDDTICTREDEADYSSAIPIKANIKKANHYFEEGHTVVYWTARGTTTGIDWREVTEKQLGKWGVKYHHLKFGKPQYDLLIEDKSENWS